MTNNKALDFWNDRALRFAEMAGTKDTIAKRLEIKAISKYIHDGMTILDFGCGNGITALSLAEEFYVHVIGIVYSPEMILSANEHSDNTRLKGNVHFEVGDITTLPSDEKFDVVYTERMIINLPTWHEQVEAIVKLTSLLKPYGKYLMCENSQDGLDKINWLRQQHNLPEIKPPWHNRYLKDDEIKTVSIPQVKLELIDYYSSTYYYLSRIVNARVAADKGEEPDYNSPINRIALNMPSIGI